MQDEKGYDCPGNFICCPKVSRTTEIRLRQDQTCLNRINLVAYTNDGPVQSQQYPWMVLMRYHDSIQKRHFYGCIGTLISQSLVLTSAHCITGLEIGVKLTSVRMGIHDVGIECPFNSTLTDDTIPKCSSVQDFSILYAWYPNEEEITYGKDIKGHQKHDIGFVVIKAQIAYTTEVMPVCLLNIPVKLDDARLVIAGWKGQLTVHEGQTLLQQNTVQVTDRSLCDDVLETHLNEDKELCVEEKVDNDNECAVEANSGSVLHLIRGDKISAYAVSSYGQNSCQNGVKLRVFTIIQPYIELMQENSRELGVHDFPMTVIEVF